MNIEELRASNDAFRQSLEQINQAIIENREKMKALREEQQANNVSIKEATEQARPLSNEYKQLIAAREEYTAKLQAGEEALRKEEAALNATTEATDKKTEATNKATEAEKQHAESLKKSDDKLKDFIGKCSLAEAGLTTVATALKGTPFGEFATAAANVTSQVRTLTTVTKALNVAMKSNVWGWVISAIAAVISWFIKATEGTEGFTNKINLLWEKCKGFAKFMADQFLGNIKAVAKFFTGDFKGAINDLKNNFSSAVDYFMSDSDDMAKSAEDTADKVEQADNRISESARKAAEERKKAAEEAKRAEEEMQRTIASDKDIQLLMSLGYTFEQAKEHIENTTKALVEEEKALKELYNTVESLNGPIDLEADVNGEDTAVIEKWQDEQKNKFESFSDYLNKVQSQSIQLSTDTARELYKKQLENYMSNIEAKIAAGEKLTDAEIEGYNRSAKEYKKVKMSNLQIAQTVLDGMSTLAANAQKIEQSGLVKSKSARKALKAIQVAGAIADTYKAATASYQAMSGIPYVGPALGAAAAAAAIVAGMANVAAIKNSDSGSVSSAQASTAAASVPQYTVQSSVSSYSQTAQSQMSQSSGSSEVVSTLQSAQPVLVVETLEQVQTNRSLRYEEASL